MTKEQQAILSIERALNQGQVFQAHNLASELRLEFPENLRITQLLVIALNRLGQSQTAIKIILEKVRQGIKDSETLGLLGRTYKDLYKQTGDRKYLKKSAESYFKGYFLNKEYYPAINAAGLFLLLNQKSKAAKIAREVIDQIGKPTDYWSTSTLGEANLILGQHEIAFDYFKQAIINNPKQFGKFQSTYAQLQFFSKAVKIPEKILTQFPKPNLAIFSGHMIDAPDRKDPRFPPEIEAQVREKLQAQIEALDIDIGFTSLASGGDILFVELLKQRNAKIKAYLPFRKEDFIDTSILFAGHGWINRFENCYNCSPKHLTTEPYLDTPELFNHLGKVMMGECMILAEHFDTKPIFISVLAPNQRKQAGGTKELHQIWPYEDTHFNIDPTQFIKEKIKVPSLTKNQPHDQPKSEAYTRKISNILFADIVGFSKLAPEVIPLIVLEIFSTIKKHIKPFARQIEVLNTWGDAILICHPDVKGLTKIALSIQNLFRGSSRISNLPSGLNIRIALHAGPIFFALDPLTGAANAYGSSINRTARMEPVTLPGEIYASDQFAALLKLETFDIYQYQHVGIIELPKGFGRQEVYQISAAGTESLDVVRSKKITRQN